MALASFRFFNTFIAASTLTGAAFCGVVFFINYSLFIRNLMENSNLARLPLRFIKKFDMTYMYVIRHWQ
jgi:hypothetical protein